MQKISPIHRFILEIIKQILDSQDLKGDSHILPCAYIPIVIFHFPDICAYKNHLDSFIQRLESHANF